MKISQKEHREIADKYFNKMNNIINIIKDFQNPYPNDIFKWDNKENLTLTRGRFNEFIHSIVENMRNDLLKEIDEVEQCQTKL